MKLTRVLCDDETDGHEYVWPPEHRQAHEQNKTLVLSAEEIAGLSISVDSLLAACRQKAIVNLAPAPIQFQAMPLVMELQQQAQILQPIQ